MAELLWVSSEGSGDGDLRSTKSWNNLAGGGQAPQTGDNLYFDPSRGGSNLPVTSGHTSDDDYNRKYNFIIGNASYTSSVASEASPWEALCTKIVWQGSGSGTFNWRSKSAAGSGTTNKIIIDSTSTGRHFVDTAPATDDSIDNLFIRLGNAKLGASGAANAVNLIMVSGSESGTNLILEEVTGTGSVALVQQQGGTVLSTRNIARYNLRGGICTLAGPKTVTIIDQSSGTMNFNTNATTTSYYMSGGVLDLNKNTLLKTITTVYPMVPGLDIRYNTDLHSITFDDGLGFNQI